MENPFGKNRTTQPNAVAEVDKSINPFGRYRKPSREEVLSGSDPLVDDLNEMRKEDEQREPLPDERQTEGVRSYDDLYGSIDKQYPESNNALQEFDSFVMSPEEQEREKSKRKAKENVYQTTGEADSLFKGTGLEGSFIDPSYRSQTERKPNPDYDPELPTTKENSPYIEKKYVVPSPEDNEVKRWALQVAENVIGGTADAAVLAANKLGLTDKEGGLTQEGEVGKAIPDQVQSDGEGIITELTTFVVGPAALEKGVKLGAKGAGALAGAAGKMAQAISPEAHMAIRNTYRTVLEATGDANKALRASRTQAKRVVTGLAFGLREAAVAPDGYEGMIVSPETVQEVFNVSPERAQDISFMLDTPAIAGTLGVLGRVWDIASTKMINPALGGLRNLRIGGGLGEAVGGGIGKLTISGGDGGLRVLTWLDPDLAKASPEEFIFRTNVLSGAMDRSAVQNVKLGRAAAEVKMDTPAAFAEVAKDYYSQAYVHLKEVFGPKEFNDWATMRAAETSNRLFELKTALISDPKALTQNAQTANKLEGIFDEASGMADGSLPMKQEQTGQILGDAQRGTLRSADETLEAAQKQADASRIAADTAISSDPEMKKLFDDFVDSSGSTAAIDNRLVESVGEPLYQSFKKMKTDVDAAYKKVADSDAVGDVASLKEAIGEEAANQPFFKKLISDAEKDPSFGNMYNNLRQTISKEIKRTSPDDPKMGVLLAARKNINEDQLNNLRFTGEGQTALDVKKAKAEYIKLNSAWYGGNLKEVENLAKVGKERLVGEKLPVPEGAPLQGVDRWNKAAVDTVLSGLDRASGETFRKSIERAAASGGQDVAGGIAEYYTAKSLSNVAGRIIAGDKESVKALRQGLKSYVNILDNMKSPLLPKVKSLEAKVQTLGQAADVDEKALALVRQDVEALRQEANKGVLSKFLENGDNLVGGDVDKTMRKIFSTGNSGTQTKQLLDQASGLGEESGIVKEAIEGTYLDYLKSKMFTNRQIGIADIDEGKLLRGYKANEVNIRKFFGPNSQDMQNLRLIFSDTPEVFEEVQKLSKLAENTTRTTTKNDDLLRQKIDKSEDPTHGLGSLIQMTLGVLNPTATRTKRILGPMAATSLEEVKRAQDAVFMAMLTDPKEFARIAKASATNVADRQLDRKWKYLILRGIGRSATTTVEDDMENLK